MDPNLHYLCVAFCVLGAGLLSCDDPIADDQNLTDKGINSATSIQSVYSGPGPAERLVTGLQGGSGSTIGPGGYLYVAENAAGKISRVDPETGEVTTFASGLPPYLDFIGIGGVMDVAFIGSTAYALVTLVGAEFGSSDVVGIYRIDGPDSFTVIANIGAFSIAHPPSTFFDVASGVQYSLQTYRGGFLVADGHHNRVLRVTLDGEITEIKTFGNIVPTGLAVSGNKIYLAQAGPIPHLPENGRVVSFEPNSPGIDLIASGIRLAVDVEFGRGQTLFALSQGIWDNVVEGTPATPNTGSLVRVNADGTITVVADELNQPTSLEIIGNTAYVVTISGEIWTIDNIAGSPFGRSPQ